MRNRCFLTIGLLLLVGACSELEPADSSTIPAAKPPATSTVPISPMPGVPLAPDAPVGPLGADLRDDLETLVTTLATTIDQDAIIRIGTSGDIRVAWVLADLLRFVQVGPSADVAEAAFEDLTGTSLTSDPPGSGWVEASNLLITWDVPAPPGYLDYKRRMFTMVEPRWEPFFDDSAAVDWRYVSWGGVFIDDRPAGDESLCPRGCIPALDDPETTPAAAGSWYPDDSIVFGIVLNGQARAYPKNMMEIHEMVNDTLGGRRLGIPYCTLCGSAQAYLTDSVPIGIELPLLRTSGLLIRSNKMMFDLNTYSLIDTFRGTAVSGSLADSGVQLEQVSVVTSTWGAWRAAHPETTILAQDGGLGRTYPADPLGGRDAGGPIFPIGAVDPRLPVQTQVLGVETAQGRFLAFPVEQVKAELDAGNEVTLAGVRMVADGSGLRTDSTGIGLPGHQAFWFAWSQFHPDTLVWSPGFGG